MSKIKLEDIKSQCAEHQWEVISEKYLKLDAEMHFKCAQGHDIYLPWGKVRDKFNCPQCRQTRQELSVAPVVKSAGVVRVLALDQASHTTGYSIFDDNKLIKVGTFVVNGNDEIARDAQVRAWLISVITNWKIDHVGIEGIQFQDEEGGRTMGVTVFQTLARLQGILMETCYEYKIPYTICPTNTWRHHNGVKGRARADKKRSMQLLAQQWYNILASDDEADAIGIGHYVSDLIRNNSKTENWES